MLAARRSRRQPLPQLQQGRRHRQRLRRLHPARRRQLQLHPVRRRQLRLQQAHPRLPHPNSDAELHADGYAKANSNRKTTGNAKAEINTSSAAVNGKQSLGALSVEG